MSQHGISLTHTHTKKATIPFCKQETSIAAFYICFEAIWIYDIGRRIQYGKQSILEGNRY